MIFRYLYFLLFFWGFGFAQDFLPSFGDVPLSPGVVLDSESVLSFEVADGRIAEVRGRSLSSYLDVRNFYRDVLPSLGWVELEVSDMVLHFVRDSEVLRIDFGGDGVVLFRLGPQV